MPSKLYMHVFIGLTAFLIIIKKEIPEGNQLGANSHVDEQFNFVDVKIILGERERVIYRISFCCNRLLPKR